MGHSKGIKYGGKQRETLCRMLVKIRLYDRSSRVISTLLNALSTEASQGTFSLFDLGCLKGSASSRLWLVNF